LSLPDQSENTQLCAKLSKNKKARVDTTRLRRIDL
jgi:hypothetical protein